MIKMAPLNPEVTHKVTQTVIYEVPTVIALVTHAKTNAERQRAFKARQRLKRLADKGPDPALCESVIA